MISLNNISSQEKVDFAKNLAVMLKSGLAVNEALDVLASQTKTKTFSAIIAKVQQEIEAGTSLSESFAKRERVFGKVFIGLFKAGENSGTLEENLDFLADWLERDHDLRQEINAATIYPKFVLSTTLIMGAGLAVFILPKLLPLFEQMRVKLPLPTRILLAFSFFVQKYWFFVLVGIAVIVISFILLNRIKFIKRIFHGLYLNMPFTGELMIDYQLALISQLFYTFSKSGMTMNQTMGITAQAATNIHYQESIEKMIDRINRGTTLAQAMKDYPRLYPKNVINIVATGEKSGSLDNSFSYLAEYYSKEVRSRSKKLPTIIEPILLIFIAVAVGFVAVSIIMPIYELTRGISR